MNNTNKDNQIDLLRYLEIPFRINFFPLTLVTQNYVIFLKKYEVAITSTQKQHFTVTFQKY